MTRAYVPQSVLDAAHARSAARAARDWAEADRLRSEIEVAGWRVVDAGTDFRLEPAHPPDIEIGGTVRYGRSSAVPSRLADASAGAATVIVLAGDDVADLGRAITSLHATCSTGVSIVVVADDPPPEMDNYLDSMGPEVEAVRTSVRLGAGAALNIGLRRATGEVVVLMDPTVELLGDAITPLGSALADPRVAVAGPFGFDSADLRTFESSSGRDEATIIGGAFMAFRRDDAAALGPVEEAFRSPRHLDAWWSLVLRDGGPDASPRAAVVVADLPLRRHERSHAGALDAADVDRQVKRNHYRLLNRFRGRGDLLGAARR